MALIVAKSQKVVMFYKYFGKNSVEIVPKSYKLKVFWLKNLIFFLVFPGFPGASFPGGKDLCGIASMQVKFNSWYFDFT